MEEIHLQLVIVFRSKKSIKKWFQRKVFHIWALYSTSFSKSTLLLKIKIKLDTSKQQITLQQDQTSKQTPQSPFLPNRYHPHQTPTTNPPKASLSLDANTIPPAFMTRPCDKRRASFLSSSLLGEGMIFIFIFLILLSVIDSVWYPGCGL